MPHKPPERPPSDDDHPGPLPRPHLLCLPAEIREIIYGYVIQVDTDIKHPRYPCEKLTSGGSLVLAYSDMPLIIKAIEGFILASWFCYEEFESCLPALTLTCRYNEDYCDGKLRGIPAMLRKRTEQLVILAADLDRRWHCIPLDNAEEMSMDMYFKSMGLFPRLSSVRVRADPMVVYKYELDHQRPVPERESLLLLKRQLAEHSYDIAKMPGCVYLEHVELDYPEDSGFNFCNLYASDVRIFKSTQPKIDLVIEWTLCLWGKVQDGLVPALLYKIEEEILEKGSRIGEHTAFPKLIEGKGLDYLMELGFALNGDWIEWPVVAAAEGC